MKSKVVFTVVLTLFVIASVSHFVYHNIINAEGETSETAMVAEDTYEGVTVYYFHNIKRCPTCTKIEELSYSTVHEKFADELASGQMRWLVINIEEPANEHYATEYELIVQSLVVVDHRPNKSGEWKNLEKIWDLVWKEEQFIEYVQSEISAVTGSN